MSTEEFLFPSFEYYLDESDPDIMVLRRQDDSFVSVFSARGATPEGIVLAAKEDYRKLVRVYMARCGKATPDVALGYSGDAPRIANPTRGRT